MNIFVEDTTDSLVTVETVGSVFVLRFKTVTVREASEISRLLESIEEGFESRTGVRVVIDMSKVEYFASLEIGKLVGVLKASKRQKGKLALCCLSGAVHDVCDAMRLVSIFRVFDGVSEAVEAVEAVAK